MPNAANHGPLTALAERVIHRVVQNSAFFYYARTHFYWGTMRRMRRALDLQPELSGWMSFDDFGLDRYYTDVVRFEGSVPSTISIGGIVFAHFMTAGNFCRPIPGITRPRS